MADALNEKICNVSTYVSGQEIIEYLITSNLDEIGLIITDFEMPKLGTERKKCWMNSSKKDLMKY